jgi:cytochrome c553
MTHRKHLKTTLVMAAVIAAVLALVLAHSPKGKAAVVGDDTESKIQRGFAIAPVPLNLVGKNRAQVGLGSYLVNAVGDCNGCHHATLSASSPYAPGGDPYQGQAKLVEQAGYLAGGTPLFGPFFLPRNLTPDKTGRPEGGASFEEFRDIMRTGIDPDQAHPQFGPFLQVMPWPAYQDMTDNDLRAIYEYLSAIPCVEGDPGLPNPRPIGTRCQ